MKSKFQAIWAQAPEDHKMANLQPTSCCAWSRQCAKTSRGLKIQLHGRVLSQCVPHPSVCHIPATKINNKNHIGEDGVPKDCCSRSISGFLGPQWHSCDVACHPCALPDPHFVASCSHSNALANRLCAGSKGRFTPNRDFLGQRENCGAKRRQPGGNRTAHQSISSGINFPCPQEYSQPQAGWIRIE